LPVATWMLRNYITISLPWCTCDIRYRYGSRESVSQITTPPARVIDLVIVTGVSGVQGHFADTVKLGSPRSTEVRAALLGRLAWDTVTTTIRRRDAIQSRFHSILQLEPHLPPIFCIAGDRRGLALIYKPGNCWFMFNKVVFCLLLINKRTIVIQALLNII